MKNCKILVPLDFSDTGIFALSAAQKMAELFDGSITPFHSYVPISDLYGPDMFGMETTPAPMENPEEIEKMHFNHLQEFVNQTNVPEQLLTQPEISIGNPAQSVVEAADNFDLIVMSSHGRSGFSRFFLGSVSDKVLRTAHIPVLTVNKEKQLTSLERIMVATDFSEHSKEAFSTARMIAQAAGAQIDLVHILGFDPHETDQPEESTVKLRRQRLQVLAKEEFHKLKSVEPKLIISSNTPHEAILNENLNNPHDLIIMSTVGRTGIDYLMMGSTTANVVRHVKSPVLSVNPKKNSVFREEE